MNLRAPKRDDWIYIAPIFCFALAAWLGGTKALQALEWKTLDWRTQIRAERGQPPPDDRLLVIGIGDHSTKNIELWPFSRAWHGQLQALIEPEAPSVLVWDIIFGNRVDVNGVPLDAAADLDFATTTDFLAENEIDTVFAAVTYGAPTGDDPKQLGASEPITHIKGNLDEVFGDEFLEMPFPGLRNSGFMGSVDAPRGPGGIVREMPMVVRVGNMVLPALALQAAMRHWEVAAADVEVRLGDAIVLRGNGGGRRIPIDEAGMMLINYRYEPIQPGEALGREMPTVEYYNVLIDLHQKHVVKAPGARDPVPLRDRIVLVGEFATDSGPTPRSDLTPLVYLHANVLNNILQDDFVKPVPPGGVWALAVAFGMLGAILVRRASVWLTAAYTIGMVAAYAGASLWAWEMDNWWLPVVAPILGFVLLQMILIGHRVITEQRAKAEIRGMFGSYLSPVVVEQMVNSETTPELGGVTAEITAYFSDIENFSAFSEKLTAAQLVELLNEYLTACTDIIQDERGTLDKYIGDAVVAMYGAPLSVPDHAYRACVSALRVQQKLDELRQKWTAEGDRWPDLVHGMRTRIGLNTGPCMIGNMGSRSRFSYTMMGDDVNLAARMESGAKSWGVYIMVTEATRTAAEAAAGRALAFRSLGRIKVKGRGRPVPIHELIGWQDEISPDTAAGIGEFERGLVAYLAKDWNLARRHFAASAQSERFQPIDGQGISTNPSLAYEKIVNELAQQQLPDTWDGVYTMRSK
jgi:adenylate cyclase